MDSDGLCGGHLTTFQCKVPPKNWLLGGGMGEENESQSEGLTGELGITGPPRAKNVQKATQGWNQEEYGSKDQQRKDPELHQGGQKQTSSSMGVGRLGLCQQSPPREI